jgi:putative sigma-54 modulation protein
MQVHFTFRNMESSEGVKNYAQEKIAKLQKFMRSPIEADVVLSLERHLQCVEVSVRADGGRFAATVESEDMYASIDLVMDKVERQVRDSKDAATDRKRHSPGVSQLSGKRGSTSEF